MDVYIVTHPVHNLLRVDTSQLVLSAFMDAAAEFFGHDWELGDTELTFSRAALVIRSDSG